MYFKRPFSILGNRNRLYKKFYIKNFFIKVFNRFLLNFDKIGLEAYKNIKILSKLNKINSKKFFTCQIGFLLKILSFKNLK